MRPLFFLSSFFLLTCLFLTMPFLTSPLHAQEGSALLQKVRARLDQVNDYSADGIMKTDVSFLKVPEAQVKVYFKKPDKLRINNEKGISLVPKGAVTISLNNLFKGAYTVLDAGSEKLDGVTAKVIKLLPKDETSDLVLSTLYIDEGRLLILRARTTTRENGTYEVAMSYGKYSSWALPDKVVFTFNTKDYKLPKGLTFDYDDGSHKPPPASGGNTKGKVEIRYTFYNINKGVDDGVFR